MGSMIPVEERTEYKKGYHRGFLEGVHTTLEEVGPMLDRARNPTPIIYTMPKTLVTFHDIEMFLALRGFKLYQINVSSPPNVIIKIGHIFFWRRRLQKEVDTAKPITSSFTVVRDWGLFWYSMFFYRESQ